jgi:GNAT superfamily N-acetyltransferase
MTASTIVYRPATIEDREWLWELKRATMREYVAAVYGWDDETQRKMFEAKFDPSRIRVVQVDGSDVGLLEVEEREVDFFLGRIEILPAFQNRGIGSAVIGAVASEARAKDKIVRLQALRSNPVRQLYERLGFSLEEETATHFKMKKEPNQAPEPMPLKRHGSH